MLGRRNGKLNVSYFRIRRLYILYTLTRFILYTQAIVWISSFISIYVWTMKIPIRI